MLFYKDKNIVHKNKTQNAWNWWKNGENVLIEHFSRKTLKNVWKIQLWQKWRALHTMPGIRQLPTLPTGLSATDDCKYRVGQKNPDHFWMLITLQWLAVERCVICQKFANFVQKKIVKLFLTHPVSKWFTNVTISWKVQDIKVNQQSVIITRAYIVDKNSYRLL